jgi:hypothetical protein
METLLFSNLVMIALPALSVFFPAEILSEQTITAAFKSVLN